MYQNQSRSNSMSSLSSYHSAKSVHIPRSDSVTDLFTLQKQLNNKKSQDLKFRNKRTNSSLSSKSMGSLANVITHGHQGQYQSNMLLQGGAPPSPKRGDYSYNRNTMQHSQSGYPYYQQQQQQNNNNNNNNNNSKNNGFGNARIHQSASSSPLVERPGQNSSSPMIQKSYQNNSSPMIQKPFQSSPSPLIQKPYHNSSSPMIQKPYQNSHSPLIKKPHQLSNTPPPFAQHHVGQGPYKHGVSVGKPPLLKQKTVNNASLQNKPLLEKSLYPVQTNSSLGASHNANPVGMLSHKGSNNTLNKYKQPHSRSGSSYALRQYAAHNANGSGANLVPYSNLSGNSNSYSKIVSPIAQPISQQQPMIPPQQGFSTPPQQSFNPACQQDFYTPSQQSLNAPPPRLHPPTAQGSMPKPMQFANSTVPQYRNGNSHTPLQQPMHYGPPPGNNPTYWNPRQRKAQALVYTGETNSVRKPGLSKRQLLKLQMRTPFEFPNGEKFTPREVQNDAIVLDEKMQTQPQVQTQQENINDTSTANISAASDSKVNASNSAVVASESSKLEDFQTGSDINKSSPERTSFASSNRTITGPKVDIGTPKNESLSAGTGAVKKSKPEPASPVKKQSKISRFFKNIFSSGSSSKPLPKQEPILQEKSLKTTKVSAPLEIKPALNANKKDKEDVSTNSPISKMPNAVSAAPPLTDLTLESPPVSPLIDIDIDMLFDSLMISSSTPDSFSTTATSVSNGSPEKPPLFPHSQSDMGSRTSSITSKSNMARLKLLQQANSSTSSLTSSNKTSSPLKSQRGIDEMIQGFDSDLTGDNDNNSESASSVHSMSDGSNNNDAYEHEDYPVFIERLGQHFSSIKTVNDDGSCKVYDSHGFIVKQDSIVSLPTTKSSNSTYKSNLHRKDDSLRNVKHKGCLHSANNSGSTNNSSLSSASSSSRANSMSTKSTSPTALSNSSQTQQLSLKFNNMVEVFPVYNSDEYERNFDLSFRNATREHLMKNIGAIKMELNQYKKFQMLVHHDSVENTHLFG